MSQTTFQSLFRAKEFATLSGRRKRNLAVLSVVTLLTFLSVGFALGGLAYLSEKLNDPFVRQLSFQANNKVTDVPNSEAKTTVKGWSELYNFKEQDVRMYGPTFNRFKTADGQPIRSYRGRSMSKGDPVLEDLCAPGNVVWKSEKTPKPRDLVEGMDDANIRIIVTRAMLVKHGYKPDDPPSYLRIVRPGDRPWQVPLLAVVKKLPDRAAYILTHNAWLALEGVPSSIYVEASDQLFVHFEGLRDDVAKNQLLNALKKEVSKSGIAVDRYTWRNGTMNVERSRWTTRDEDVLELQLQRGTRAHFDLANKLTSFFQANQGTPLYAWGGKGGVRIPDQEGADKFKNMSVYFNSLEKVTPFAERLTAEYEKVEVDLSSIENKDSLRLFSGLAYILAIFLIGFSILSITTFVNSLISAHFQRIQRNLGTLKAFGLSKKVLMRAYARISLVFVLISTAVGFVVAMGIGSAGTMRLMIQAARLPLAPNVLYFDLFNAESAITFVVIVIASYFFVRINLNRLLKYTPGELIYDRV